ncbi:MAG: hypothetical protein J0G94_10140, partial [Sphingomonadales bacterium]|nr:hypothetical protein [Sphingomonadales bacterium]
MKARFVAFAAIAFACIQLAGPVQAAKKAARTYVMVNEEVGLPVFPYDITDRPYEVLGEVQTSVRKATIFSKAPSQVKKRRRVKCMLFPAGRAAAISWDRTRAPTDRCSYHERHDTHAAPACDKKRGRRRPPGRRRA